jgi:hypothetical protein
MYVFHTRLSPFLEYALYFVIINKSVFGVGVAQTV